MLGTLATASGSNNLRRRHEDHAKVRPWVLLHFVASLLILFFHSILLVFFICFFVLFTYCPHMQVFGRMLVHEFHIFYCHSKWNCIFFALLRLTLFWFWSSVKLNITLIMWNSILFQCTHYQPIKESCHRLILIWVNEMQPHQTRDPNSDFDADESQCLLSTTSPDPDNISFSNNSNSHINKSKNCCSCFGCCHLSRWVCFWNSCTVLYY